VCSVGASTTVEAVVPTLVDMPTVKKPVTVAFYAIEPRHAFDGQREFTSGAFPRDDVFTTIRRRDPAERDYRITEDLFGGETLCLLHENGPEPILGAYYRDNLGKLLTEYKGQIVEAMLREGEAPVDAGYLAFFPSDTVGLVRTSSKSPGFAKVGRWLTVIGGYSCGLTALPDADTLAQLQNNPTGLRGLLVRAQRGSFPFIESHSPSVAQALRAAADVNSQSEQSAIEVRATGSDGDDVGFSREALDRVSELMGALEAIEEVKVQLSGRRQPINLKRAHVKAQMSVRLEAKRRVGLAEAADVLFAAYEQERESVELAVAALRRHFRDPPIG
jgi:hypothetical protein